MKNKHFLFICTGNTCRSPLAEGLFQLYAKKSESGHRASSAGIFAYPGSKASSAVISLLREKGVDFSSFQSSLVSKSLLKEATDVICFTREHLSFLIQNYPSYREKYSLIGEIGGEIGFCEIADPFGKGEEGYRSILSYLEEKIPHLL